MFRDHHSLAVFVLCSGCAGTADTGSTVADSMGEDDAGVSDATCTACEHPGDSAPDAAPQAPADTCGNGIDDDGNGQIDEQCGCREGQSQRCYRGDQSRAGVGLCTWGKQTCSVTMEGEFQLSEWSPCEGQGEGTPEELCGDGLDNDCNGRIDDSCPCRPGATEDCQTACGAGLRTCNDGAFGSCEPKLKNEEICNGIDDDCDGLVDEELTRSCSSACGMGSELCSAGRWSSCSAALPGAETCNGLDDDCDGVVDTISRSCSSACGVGVESCNRGAWTCNARQPSAETCNRLDDDCDGVVDDGLKADWHFINRCRSSRVFITFGGCNICDGSTCNGYWIDPGDTLTLTFDQNLTFKLSAIADKATGDVCLDEGMIGGVTTRAQVHTVRNVDCFPQDFGLNVSNGC
jgi:Putative metal-binding motif